MATANRERRALQALVAVASLVPILGGAAGVALGPRMVGAAFGSMADSHFRYLSGLLLAIGVTYLSLVKHIEREGQRLFMLTAIVVTGGCARAFGMLAAGDRGPGVAAALVMELIVAPAVFVWQGRVAASMDAPAGAR